MVHHVAHARGLAFRDGEEGHALWQRVARRLPGTRAVVLMPDHVHVLRTSPEPQPLDSGLRAYALWRNHHRGERGPVWLPRPPVEALANPTHHRRSIRYLHLHPCRAGLAGCPAAWPLSTHREPLGLASRPMRQRDGDPVAFPAYVSGDPSAQVDSTEYPGGRLHSDRPGAGPCVQNPGGLTTPCADPRGTHHPVARHRQPAPPQCSYHSGVTSCW